jgi:hypothetical protein
VQEAISIFKEAFPGVQALFFFDHSSAHATLPEDSLKAFEMNKKDGGRQRVQRDTIFPTVMDKIVPMLVSFGESCLYQQNFPINKYSISYSIYSLVLAIY